MKIFLSVLESKHVQFEKERKGDNLLCLHKTSYRELQLFLPQHIQNRNLEGGGRARMVPSRQRRAQTAFLALANGKQWADSIDDFNLSWQKTRCFAQRYIYRHFKTQKTERRNGFTENAFLDYAVKMCVSVKHIPMSKLKKKCAFSNSV